MSTSTEMVGRRKLRGKAAVAKAAELLTGDGGMRVEEQADEFWLVATNRPGLLQDVRVQPVDGNGEQINEMIPPAQVLYNGQEGVALSPDKWAKPTFAAPTLHPKLLRGVIGVSVEQIEDNLVRERVIDYLESMAQTCCGRDVERLSLRGDVTSTDPALNTFDGLLIQAVSHTYDHQAGTPNDDLFANSLDKMPSQFVDYAKLRYYTSHKAVQQYRRYVSNRMTVDGDEARRSAVDVEYSSMPIKPLQLLDESHGTSSKCTDLIFTDPDNITVGYAREVMIELDKNILSGLVLLAISTRVHALYGVEDAVVKALNVKVQK